MEESMASSQRKYFARKFFTDRLHLEVVLLRIAIHVILAGNMCKRRDIHVADTYGNWCLEMMFNESRLQDGSLHVLAGGQASWQL
ncbi:hypothetical protein Tco_0227247 [Tanacetum coccineum]